jgi:hypothetical protein
MKLKLISALIMALLFCGQLFASNPSHPLVPAKSITLTGVVTDFYSGEALAGAQVEVEGTNTKVFTDLDGKFSITVDAQYAFNLKVKYISYEDVTIKNNPTVSTSNELLVKLHSK